MKDSREKKLAVFTDFDGTITRRDYGDEIFIGFGEFEPHNSRLKNGEMTIFEYWITLCNSLRPGVGKHTIQEFALTAETDPYFPKFAEFCRRKSIPLTVVSDGFDTYVRPIMDKLGLSDLPVKCNSLDFSRGDKPVPIFPGADESCKCFCASCKRNAVLSSVAEDAIIVYIGDGYSDFCAAKHSDIVFAKKSLAAYCNENKIPHYPFSSFFDVIRFLESAIEKGKIKKRNSAELLRKKAFETE